MTSYIRKRTIQSRIQGFFRLLNRDICPGIRTPRLVTFFARGAYRIEVLSENVTTARLDAPRLVKITSYIRKKAMRKRVESFLRLFDLILIEVLARLEL